MTNPVSSFASRAVARRISGSPATAARRATSTRFGPETRQMIGSGPVLARGDEDERLHDLAELGADGRGGSSAVWVDSAKVVDLEHHALARGRVEDALDRRVVGVSGTAGV